MDIRFGATIVQVIPFPEVLDDFLFAESIGLDNGWVIDQFGIDEAPDITLLEAWTTLAAVAARTERIRIGTMVTNAAMRNPAVLATSILTVDQISGGRVVTAIGGGYYPAEHAALGIDFLDGIGRTERLRETVEVLDRALRGETVTYSGEHVAVHDATFRPMPTQLPRPPIWVAAQGPRSLRIAARLADGITTLGAENQGIEISLPAFRDRMTRADEICAEVGRDPSTLRRCYFAGWADEPIFASVEAATDIIGRYFEAGATDITFYLHNPAEPVMDGFLDAHRAGTREQFEQLAAEVFPRFRTRP
jgi:alkanesulfonate monooxygenase SsuD/methylene tetrahydromethanopterin reductase-like flavin-dependent oxidoreductase (luciferase family)